MNISPVKLNTHLNIYKNTHKAEKVKAYKPVTFSGLTHIFDNGNSYRAYLLGKDLFDNPNQPADETVKKYAPSIKVLPIDKKLCDDFDALIMHNRNDNFEAENIRIYTPLKPKKNTKSFKLAYALPLAHEFTHYMQLTSSSDVEFMKKISDNNIDYLRSFLPVADALFDYLDTIGLIFTNNAYNFIDAINEKIYGFVMPRVKSVSEEKLLSANGMETFGDFKDCMLKKFDENSEALFDEILNESYVDEKIKKFVNDVTLTPESKKEFKEKLKTYCAYKARKEKEAYQTESALSKEIIHTTRQLNTDSSIMYYSMLERALS